MATPICLPLPSITVPDNSYVRRPHPSLNLPFTSEISSLHDSSSRSLLSAPDFNNDISQIINGNIGEVCISNISRSPAWLKASYFSSGITLSAIPYLRTPELLLRFPVFRLEWFRDHYLLPPSDGEYQASNDATFTVNPVNDAPEVSDIPDQTIDEGQTFETINLNEYVTDIDEDTITWTASGNVELTIDITDGIATITIPSIDWNGSETITFTANDGEYEASDEATFTVNPVNDAPEVSDIPGQTIDEGQTFTSIDLNEYVTDIDEDYHHLDRFG